MSLKTFQHINKDQQDKIVANLVEAVNNLSPLQCPDLDETADAIYAIAQRLRTQVPSHGLLMFAKVIIEQAFPHPH